ncbi:MAG: hypothetical protein FJW21_04790 [Acidimicrobiia bacterium]|nr:hypothetical protein [Acidimicrobiia bacterium]
MLLWTVSALLVAVSGGGGVRADGMDAWMQLHERTRLAFETARPGSPAEGPAIVVGFTGGQQKATSLSSGVVQVRKAVDERYADRPDLTTVTYNNREWRRAAETVLAHVRSTGAAPVIVVYGHSLGGGSVTKFARELERAGVDVTLAVYVDAVGIRNPRVPGNVRFAVNFYQRGGPLRGFPFRGKRVLVLEDASRTETLGNLHIKPVTPRSGWHWNLIQPLLYRQHHRIGHDVRLQNYIVDVLSISLLGEEGVYPIP